MTGGNLGEDLPGCNACRPADTRNHPEATPSPFGSAFPPAGAGKTKTGDRVRLVSYWGFTWTINKPGQDRPIQYGSASLPRYTELRVVDGGYLIWSIDMPTWCPKDPATSTCTNGPTASAESSPAPVVAMDFCRLERTFDYPVQRECGRRGEVVERPLGSARPS